METINSKLEKYYLEKIRGKENGLTLIEAFIEANLTQEEHSLSLGEYLRLQSTVSQPIIQSKQATSRIFPLELECRILPLSFITTPIDPQALSAESKYLKGLVSIHFTFFQVLDDSRFPKHTFFLLKIYCFKDKTSYCTFLLNPEGDRKLFMVKESFFLEILPEFLPLITKPKFQYDVYTLRNFLFDNATRYLITYTLNQEDDCQRIEAGLKSRNEDVQVRYLVNLKKSLLIKTGGKELKVKFLESKIELIQGSLKFRTKSLLTLKGDLDDYVALIVKAVEPESGYCHYIYVTGHHDPEIKLMVQNKKGPHRLSVTALFDKIHGEYVFHDRTLDSREPLLLSYTPIEKVELSKANSPKILSK